MAKSTIVLILLSILIAFALSFFQYYYKAKSRSKVQLLLASFRFLSIFGILLLLINPKISRETYRDTKPPLAIVFDNSGSIAYLKQDSLSRSLVKKITENKALQQKYDIHTYAFATDFESADQFTFKGAQTNIDQAGKQLKSLYKNKKYPTVLLSDGNQTIGSDYVYGFDAENAVFPIVLGDTISYLDVRINGLNVNKYAFLKNKFPVEVLLQYNGKKAVTADFIIQQGSAVLHKQKVNFSPQNKSAVLQVVLPADKVGLQVFKASVLLAEKEKNTYNNTKNFAVEVIDQKSEIAIISEINHPDVGALKRAISANTQRKVTVVQPSAVESLQDYNVLIFYQPTAAFKTVFEKNKIAGINSWVITGLSTDYNLLNQYQDVIGFKMTSQKEDYTAAYNAQFNLFALDDIGFESFPPLQNGYGTLNLKQKGEVLLSSKVRNIDTNAPMLVFTENQSRRNAFLLGENLWKWRLQYYVDKKSFEGFDIFIDKTIQYLSSANSGKRLVVHHESFYNSGDAITIAAEYFNKNYEFDDKARLSITVTNKKSKAVKNYDMLKGNNSFRVNLDGFAAGAYAFTVKELNSNTVYSSHFEILDFDMEKQFVNPDVPQLQALSLATGGKLYYPGQAEKLIKSLLENEQYQTVQKAIVEKKPLIDSVLLLVLIALLLAAEWFVRKYNGML